jgi:hypothetical protein
MQGSTLGKLCSIAMRMFPLHWRTLWFGLVVTHPYLSPVTILLSLSSPSSSYHKRCCKDRPIQLIFSQSFSGQPPCMHYPKFKMIMHQPSALATLSIAILLSAQINSSNRCTVASVTIWTGWPGQASFATFECPWENFSTQLWTASRNKHFPPQTGNISLWIWFS